MIHYRLCMHPVLLGAGALSALSAIIVGTACADVELGDIRRTTRLAALATTAAHTVDNAVERVSLRRVSLGHRSAAYSPHKRLSHRSGSVDNGGALAALSGTLQWDCLAYFLCRYAQAYGPRGPMHSAIGT